MTRKIWAAIACFLVLVMSIGTVLFNGNIYDTNAPIYSFVGRLTPKTTVDHAETYGDLMRRQDMDGLRKVSHPDMVSPDFYQAVPKIAAFYPHMPPKSVAPIQYSLFASTEGTRSSTVVITHTYADGSVILTTTITDINSGKVKGFSLRKLSAADLRTIEFAPLRANVTQAAILTIAIAVFIFTLATVYVCLATPALKWKWLWFIFIMAGFGSLRFNWLTNVVNFVPIDIHWGAAGYWQLLLEPAIVYINFPLGAVVYWLTRIKKTKPAVA